MDPILSPLIGGLLIGLSSTMMLGGIGKISGISGILSTSLFSPGVESLWRYFFLFGLIIGGVIIQSFAPHFFQYELKASLAITILAGLLVGFGTRLGRGCTSGHGVCGLGRGAKRSVVATLIFISFAIITVSLKGGL